jgi:hypothetical protein
LTNYDGGENDVRTLINYDGRENDVRTNLPTRFLPCLVVVRENNDFPLLI